MKKPTSLGWGMVAIVAGVLALSVGSTAAGTPGAKHEVEFSLAVTGGEPAPFPFTLAPCSTEPTALAGPGGFGLVEDSNPPYRTAIGYMALAGNTTGSGNTAVGYWALYQNSDGSNNTAVGFQAFQHGGGNDNTAIGANTRSGYSGSFNTAVGSSCLGGTLGSGNYNTAIGYNVLAGNEGGVDYSTACGALALNGIKHGNFNTAVGYGALEIIGSSLQSSQSYNTAIGYKAGSLTLGGSGRTGWYNIFIGANQAGETYDTNSIRIGLPYDTTAQSGQNRTFIAGIVEYPFTPAETEIPAVVGILSTGQLGTVPADLLPTGPEGPVGPPGPQGLAGEGLVHGSILMLPASIAPPVGYIFLGSTIMPIKKPGRRATVLTINVYQKQ